MNGFVSAISKQTTMPLGLGRLGSDRAVGPTGAGRLGSLELAAAVTIVVFALLVGVDGPAPWPTVRAAAVLAVGTGVVLANRRFHRVAGAVTVLGFGLASVIVGLGIGISHLVRTPLSVEAVTGTSTLIGGIALVVGSVGRLLEGRRRWWRLLAPVGLGTVVLVVLPLTLAVFVTNAPPFAPVAVTPADRGLAYEDVELVTSDGVRLHGQYVASTNGAAVIVLGGVSGIGEQEMDIAVMLAEHGYGVLLQNVRGQGRSDGDAMMWGWWGEIDVAAGIDYLAARPDVAGGRIGAIGMSVGGEQAISAAGIDHRLRAVVSEGATARGARDEGDPARGFGGLVTRHVDWLSMQVAAALTDADTPTPLRDSLAAFDDGQRALLIAAGTSAAEVAATEVFRAAAADRVDVWIAPDTAHTGAFRTHRSDWEARVVAFLDDTLQPA